MEIEQLLSYLTSLASYVTIPLDGVLEDIIRMNSNKILEKHKYEIYYSHSEKAWRTYLPDDTKPNKRKPVKRANKENLEKLIIQFYLEQYKKESIQSMTLEDVYKKWLIYRRDNTPVKPKTIEENVNEWNHFIQGTELADMPIIGIKPITLIRFFRKITKNRTETQKRISNVRSVLNGIFTHAIEEEIIVHNPISDVNFKSFYYKPIENQSDNVFTANDVQILLSYLRTLEPDPYILAIQLFFNLFIRIGELKAIKNEDISISNRYVYLHHQALTERVLKNDFTFEQRTVSVSNQMKGNTSKGFRKEYLTDNALMLINKARELNPDGIYLFEPDGKLMTTDRFNRRLEKYCNACGIKYHSSHKIRFYNASTAYTGDNLVTISKLMGHSKIETTLHYLRDVKQDNNDISAFKKLGVQKCSNKNK